MSEAEGLWGQACLHVWLPEDLHLSQTLLRMSIMNGVEVENFDKALHSLLVGTYCFIFD